MKNKPQFTFDDFYLARCTKDVMPLQTNPAIIHFYYSSQLSSGPLGESNCS